VTRAPPPPPSLSRHSAALPLAPCAQIADSSPPSRTPLSRPASTHQTAAWAAHTKDIFALSASRDGQYLASGGADKAVSVWSWDLAQKYTFEHTSAVQALAFNPITPNILATASGVDFAVWTMPSSSLKKIKVPSRVCCMAWTSDGQVLALGLHSGAVSLRDLAGVERQSIKRGGPVWDLSWAPLKGAQDAAGPLDVLSVACWDGTLSFYTADGKAYGKERAYGAGGGSGGAGAGSGGGGGAAAPTPGSDPTSVRPFINSEYLLTAGSDRRAALATRDGIRLNTLTEGKDWLWRAVPRPRSNYFATACNDGTISMHNLVFTTVHGLYGDRYASRESCTDVLVRHLVSDARVRIKCRCVLSPSLSLPPPPLLSLSLSLTLNARAPHTRALGAQGLCEKDCRVPRPPGGAAV
jgi:intraflagellar transport protein 122